MIEHEKANTLRTMRGKTEDGKQIVAWDIVPFCSPMTCCIKELCPYDKGVTKKCQAEVKYLSTVFKLLIDTNKQNLSEMQLHKAGILIMPLYHQLFIMKKAAYAVADPIYESKHTLNIHPIFKEIREIIKTINSMLKDNFDNITLPENEDAGKIQDLEKLFENGNPKAYEALYDSLPEDDEDEDTKTISFSMLKK